MAENVYAGRSPFDHLPEQDVRYRNGPPRAPIGQDQAPLNRFWLDPAEFMRGVDGTSNLPFIADLLARSPAGGEGDGLPPMPPDMPRPIVGPGFIDFVGPAGGAVGGGGDAKLNVVLPGERGLSPGDPGKALAEVLPPILSGFLPYSALDRVQTNLSALALGLKAVTTSAVGENLLLNADFTSFSGGSTAVPDAWTAVGVAPTFASIAAGGVTLGGGNGRGMSQGSIPIKPSTTYTLSIQGIYTSIGAATAKNLNVQIADGTNTQTNVVPIAGTSAAPMNVTTSFTTASGAANLSVQITLDANQDPAWGGATATVGSVDLHLGQAATPDPIGKRDRRIEPRGWSSAAAAATNFTRLVHESHDVTFGTEDVTITKALIGTYRGLWDAPVSFYTDPGGRLFWVSATGGSPINQFTLSRTAIGVAETVFVTIFGVPS